MSGRRIAVLCALIALASADLRAGTLTVETTLQMGLYGRLRAAGYATFMKEATDFGDITFKPVFFIDGTDAFYTTPQTSSHTNWSIVIRPSEAAQPPNCYVAKLDMWAAASLGPPSTASARSTPVCLYGPPPSPELQPACEYEYDPYLEEHVQRCYSPLIVDLDRDGIRTTGNDSPVLFDIRGTGSPELITWTAPSGEDAFLYLDLNNNHVVDGGHELFGTASRGSSGAMASNGFTALAVYDESSEGGNGDGTISPGDRVWGRLRLWVDRDHDGVADLDENDSLQARGVESVALLYTTVGPNAQYGRDENGNFHYLRGTIALRWRGQKHVGVVEDVFFRPVR